MGGLFSTKFKMQEGVPGQDGIAMETFRKLHFAPHDVDVLFDAFHDMDADKSHYIRRDEFCAYFYMEKTPLTIKMTKMMDTEGHGCLDFLEMVALLWDFLSRDPKSLGSFAFHLIDETRKGFLTRAEVTELVELLHHTTASKHKGVNKIIADICTNKIDAQSFHDYCFSHEEVCWSLIGVQNSLRERILGKSFWEEMTHRRSRYVEQMKVDYIFELLDNVNTKRAKLRKKAKRDEKKRRRSSIVEFIFDKNSSRNGDGTRGKIPTKQRAARRESVAQVAIGMIRKKPKPGAKKNRKKKQQQVKSIKVNSVMPKAGAKIARISPTEHSQEDTSRLD
mmetsp:Transcript_25473/g.42950  ORF Transcript_25473/g.42950 Transcript_25473/m.42950 type:complete len:335 (+) Transcript_25473:78-1082(+)